MTASLTDTLLALLPDWGPWLVGLATLLSCLLLPVPSSLIMIAAGAFVASGDLSLGAVAGAALAGAVAGDQIGFWVGRRAGAALLGRARGKSGALAERALAMLRDRGGVAVFLSRWLFSPLGPWMNLAAGAAGFARSRFTLAGVAGEAVWVGLYVGLGMVFGANLQAAADLAGSALGLLAAGTVAAALGAWLMRNARAGD